jgi:hypothetical protein
MPFEITTYYAVRMKAAAEHSVTDHWVDVEVTEQRRRGPPTISTMTVFFAGEHAERKADAYAKAINTVDQQFHPVDAVLERSLEWVREEMGR